MSTTTRSVAVFGSCTSRDNFNSRFNPEYGRWFHVAAEAFQTSPIALMSAPVDGRDIAELLTGPGSGDDGEPVDYRIRIAREDATRSFLPRLAAAQPDFLILDFVADIHFGVLQLPDGRFLTDNRWMLHPTRYYDRLRFEGDLRTLSMFSDTEEYVTLWTDAIDRFAAFVAENCPETRVVVHRGLNVDEVVVGGSDRPVRLREHRKARPLNVQRANELWARLDDYAINTHGWESIDLRDEGYTSYDEHPWKPFYVHYTTDYYHRFLAELLVLDLTEGLAEDDADQVRANERIRELESLGPVKAAKFALGQRIRETRARRGKRTDQKEKT